MSKLFPELPLRSGCRLSKRSCEVRQRTRRASRVALWLWTTWNLAPDCIPQSPFHPFPKTPPVWGSIWSMLVLSVLSPCFCGQFIFLFKPQRHLLIRKDFNWTQFTFNSFESTFNWFSFETSKKSIDTKGFQLNSIYFQFIWICFQLIFLFEPQRNLLIRNDFTWTTSHNRASPQTNGKILNWAGKTSHNREPGH